MTWNPCFTCLELIKIVEWILEKGGRRLDNCCVFLVMTREVFWEKVCEMLWLHLLCQFCRKIRCRECDQSPVDHEYNYTAVVFVDLSHKHASSSFQRMHGLIRFKLYIAMCTFPTYWTCWSSHYEYRFTRVSWSNIKMISGSTFHESNPFPCAQDAERILFILILCMDTLTIAHPSAEMKLSYQNTMRSYVSFSWEKAFIHPTSSTAGNSASCNTQWASKEGQRSIWCVFKNCWYAGTYK